MPSRMGKPRPQAEHAMPSGVGGSRPPRQAGQMRISSNLESMVTALSILRRVRAFPSRIMRALDDRGEGLTVLVVRTGALGDILRTLPPVRLLRDALPRARIHWAIDERWTLALDGHGDLDGLVALPLAAMRRTPVERRVRLSL